MRKGFEEPLELWDIVVGFALRSRAKREEKSAAARIEIVQKIMLSVNEDPEISRDTKDAFAVLVGMIIEAIEEEERLKALREKIARAILEKE